MTDARLSIRLSDIVGLDPKVVELEKTYGIPPYVHIRTQDLTADALLTLLELCPIICRQRGDKIYCVANIRSYQLARQFIDLDLLVPVRMVSTRRLEEIERLFVADRLLLPITANHGRGKSKWILTQWQNLRPTLSRLWKKAPFSDIKSHASLARLLDVDPRTLK